MKEISTSVIKEAVYKLCFEANTCLNADIYNKILSAFNTTKNKETKSILFSILQNAKIACDKKMPLCQDTGQVIVFFEIGQNIHLNGDYIEYVINQAVSKCYKDNYLRKSVVKNSLFDRTNTKDNTPVIIYTKIIAEDEIRIKVLIKGAGSENKSKLEMMLPTTNEEEFIQKTADLILSAKENACPPMFIGIGIGQSADGAMILSKKALVEKEFTDKEIELANKIKDSVNKKAPKKYGKSYVLDVKLLSSPTHIACMPVAVTINCHSDRYSSCIIKNNKITYNHKTPKFIDIIDEKEQCKEIMSSDINGIKSLKKGQKILLTGEIYVARDMAHKKLIDMIEKGEELPFDLKNRIILYAGPTPAKPGEISGSIGPTTALRMDKYTPLLYDKGIIATIGKGDRNKEVKTAIKNNAAKYFTVQGGIAALISRCIKKSEIIAFEELGAEAIYKLKISKLPVKTEIA